MPDLSVIGAQRVAIDYGFQLEVEGYDVKFVCGLKGIWESDVCESKVYYFSPLIFKSLRGLRVFEGFFVLALLIKRENYDVILSVTPLINRVLCFYKLLGLISGRLVIEEHAYPPRSNPDEFPNLLVRVFYSNTEWLYKYADVLRTLTEDTKLYYLSRQKKIKVIVFPNLMNLERIEKLANIPIEKSEVVDIIYIGRFTTQKNILFLISAFHSLTKKINVTLGIIGYGVEEYLIKERVKELGLEEKVKFIENSKKNYALLKNAAIFPLVSLWEGFPLVLIEAMLLGVAVVSVDCRTGPRELIDGEKMRGWLVPENDLDSFVLALESALKDAVERKQRTVIACKYVVKNLNINRRFQEYINLFIEKK